MTKKRVLPSDVSEAANLLNNYVSKAYDEYVRADNLAKEKLDVLMATYWVSVGVRAGSIITVDNYGRPEKVEVVKGALIRDWRGHKATRVFGVLVHPVRGDGKKHGGRKPYTVPYWAVPEKEV